MVPAARVRVQLASLDVLLVLARQECNGAREARGFAAEDIDSAWDHEERVADDGTHRPLRPGKGKPQ